MILDVTAELEAAIADVVEKVAEFAHVDPARLLVGASVSRRSGSGGVFARIHPLRFPGGGRRGTLHRGRRSYLCEIPPVIHEGRDMLYALAFLVPRFLLLPPQERATTVVHELYHISPEFNGDLRRFPGRNYAHGTSRKRYDLHMHDLAQRYLSSDPSPRALSFLCADHTAAISAGRLAGRRFRAPKPSVVESWARGKRKL